MSTKTVPTLSEFYDLLERHQWFAEMADSREIEAQAEAELKAITDIIWASKDDRYSTLYGEFYKHMWSGPTWGTPQHPKPVRPVDAPQAA